MDANQERMISKVVAKAWMDGALYQRLLTEPKRVLREAGVVLGSLAVVVVVMSTGQEASAATLKHRSEFKQETVLEIVLPPEPQPLSEESLTEVEDEIVVAFCLRVCVC